MIARAALQHHNINDAVLRRRLLDECGLDLDAIPPLLREADIVRDPKRSGRGGLLPITRASFRDAVSNGLIAKPVRLGQRTIAWRRLDILRVLLDGTHDARRILRTRRTVAPTAD